MSENTKVTEAASQLAQLIVSGQASEADKGLVLRTLQIGMASHFAAQIGQMHSVITSGMQLYKDLEVKYQEQLAEQLEVGMSLEEIRDERNAMEERILTMLEIERKVIQGKSLFPEDTLSEDDRKVLRILSSIKSEDDRTRFFAAIDAFLQNKNSFEEDVAGEAPAELS